MSSFFPNGTQYSFSTTLGAAIAVTAISNANPAVATASAPPTNGSIVLVTSGWSALNDTAARVAGTTATTFELEGVDTTSTTRFPASAGAGSVKVAGAFTSLTQIQNVQMSGGEQQFYQYQYVDDGTGRQRQKPTFKNAQALAFSLDYDPALGWYDDLVAADLAGALVVLKAVLPSGDTILYLGYPSFNKTPTVNKNENQQVTATFSLVCDSIRYAA